MADESAEPLVVGRAGERQAAVHRLFAVSYTHLVANMLAVLADKNLLLNRRLEHLSKRTTREKLLSYLAEQARLCGGPSFSIPLDRQELADYLCVERSAMSAELGRLRDQGALRFERNHFILAGAGAVKPEAGR